MFSTTLGTGRKESGTFKIEQLFNKSGNGNKGKSDKRKRVCYEDASSESYSGPWGGYEDEVKKSEELKLQMELRAEQAKKQLEITSKESVFDDVEEKKTSVFHGKKMQDWQGRSWLEPAPSLLTRGDDACYLPKKLLHTWKGHTKGLQSVCLFPTTGHFLLSASMDSTIKIWDYFNDRECRMTYTGHSQGVRDIQFAGPSGLKFYSSSFDTNVHLWDTEVGKIVSTFSNGKMAYSIAVHPTNPDSFIVGSQDRTAIQYDAKSGKVVQSYNEHLGTVSSVTFCDEGRKIITTSDDRKIFIWNYGIPVVDKYISEPHMHAVPAVAVHPNGQHFVGQSMNNTIVTYQATGQFRFESKKKFFGHANAGYAIQPSFSHDGKYLVSGGSEGSVHFWDWKSTKLYRSLKAHDGVCMGAVWHPKHASRVVTCGWDNLIKLWD